MDVNNKGSPERCIGHWLSMTEDEDELRSPENFVDLLIDDNTEEELNTSFNVMDLLMDDDNNNEASAVPITLTKSSNCDIDPSTIGSDDIERSQNKESERQSKQSKLRYELCTPRHIDFEAPTTDYCHVQEEGATHYVHEATVRDMESTLTFGECGTVTFGGNYVLEKPMIVDASSLDDGDPFCIRQEHDGMLTLMVAPIASSVEVISKGTGFKATLKLKEDMAMSVQKKKGSTSRENMCHYGYSSSPRSPGPFLHAIVKEKEENDVHVFTRTVKLLRKYKGTDAICEAAVKSIGNDILSILSKNSDTTLALTEHQEWWKMANNLHSQLVPGTEYDKDVFVLDENVVGCHHTTCTIGTGFQQTSPVHTDVQSASANWAGLPDFHLNLSENKNIGFLHYAIVGKDRVQPIIVIQDRLTTTFFYGASTAHGTVHIGTYLDRINISFAASGNGELATEVRPEWRVPAERGEQRVYITYYTKSTLPVTCEIQRAYNLMRVAPRFYFTTKDGGKGQVADDREMNAIRWDSHVIGTGARTVGEMRDIQCNGYNISGQHVLKVDQL
jgi:hypothetical protein